MSIFNKKKILVTHNGTFHADDIFATATLAILLDNKIKVIRTRDEKIISKADFVYDVGGIDDAKTNHFDHHQIGGAGKRENGVPYASFGLVWKKYGETVCGSIEVAKKIDTKLVQAIDANDNGVNLFNLVGETAPYTFQDIIFAYRPSWKEEPDYDKAFFELVILAKKILEREIKKMQDELEARTIVIKAYEKSEDKRIVIIDGSYPWGETLGSFSEPLYVVFPKTNTWRVECVRKEKYSFENRKSLPESWAGKRDKELVEITGIPDATFCHNGRFMAVANSKEGAIALANKALLE